MSQETENCRHSVFLCFLSLITLWDVPSPCCELPMPILHNRAVHSVTYFLRYFEREQTKKHRTAAVRCLSCLVKPLEPQWIIASQRIIKWVTVLSLATLGQANETYCMASTFDISWHSCWQLRVRRAIQAEHKCGLAGDQVIPLLWTCINSTKAIGGQTEHSRILPTWERREIWH